MTLEPRQMNIKAFFLETRDHIKHEDGLIHHRMSWLIALQAFLFSAYGFSLSAEATVIAARIAHNTCEVDFYKPKSYSEMQGSDSLSSVYFHLL